MNKIELLAPAGNLEKLKIAYKYGADAVYIGGEKFSLRARANNFTLSDLKEAGKIAKKLNKKVYVTMNILPHDEDLNGLDEYLKALESYHITGIIASSMTIIDHCIKLCPKLEAHVSTQMSSSNSNTVNYFKSLGVKRVVLARECSINEIRQIRHNTDIGLEVFIHGGMCSSYSGRCMLSNHMVNRDANRGGCAHSCRWNYDLYDGDNKLNSNGYFNIGSKDLMSLEMIPKLIDIGVDSLKIEGRMKSEYYIATVVKAYRLLIDEYYKYEKIKDYNIYYNEIKKAENRLTSHGFFNGRLTSNEQMYDRDDKPTKEFVGMVLNYNLFTKIATIKQRNYFKVDDELEFFSLHKSYIHKVNEMKDEKGEIIECANHPEMIVKMKVKCHLHKDDMIRLIKK